MYAVLLNDSGSSNGNLITLTDNSETREAEYAVDMIKPLIDEMNISPL